MELAGTRIDASPERKGHVRLTGEVRYANGWAPEAWWYEVPERFAGDLTSSGNPWLACLLPLAATIGEPLRISAPVDPLLLENAAEIVSIWRLWYPALPAAAAIEAPLLAAPAAGPRRTAAYFSGGIDSLFTILRPRPRPIDDLILIQGSFDLPLAGEAKSAARRDAFAAAAGELGRELVPVATNLLTTRFREADLEGLSLGGGYLSVALALERRFARVLFASSHEPLDLCPYGSHPVTDALFSTGALRIDPDGLGSSRLDKTELVARSALALRTLRVCNFAAADGNCGRCEKCYRTRLSLTLLGVAGEASTLDLARFDLVPAAGVIARPTAIPFYVEIEARARARGRADVARAAGRMIRRSRRFQRMLALAASIGRWPVVGPLLGPIRRALRRWLFNR